MKCSLDETSSSPHSGKACLRWYQDQQDSRYTQVLCDGHDGNGRWQPVKPMEKPLAAGFVGKHGYQSRKGRKDKESFGKGRNPAHNGTVPQGVEGYLEELTNGLRRPARNRNNTDVVYREV